MRSRTKKTWQKLGATVPTWRRRNLAGRCDSMKKNAGDPSAGTLGATMISPPIIVRYLAETIAAKVLTWRTNVSDAWQQRKRDRHKQHWQAGDVAGGAVIQLGFMTQAEAIARIQLLKGENEPIIYVDFERGFIAHGRQPGST